jgi:hypothetical protein
MADREGRLEDRPKRIKKELLGYEDLDAEGVDGMLSDLGGAGFIRRYEAGGEAYIQVVNFSKHQAPYHREQPSKIPPPQAMPGQDTDKARPRPGQDTAKAALIPDSLIPDSLIPDQGQDHLPGAGKPAPGGSSEKEPDDGAKETGASGMGEADPAVIRLPLNDKSLHPVTESMRREWQALYPAIDVMQELRAMLGWLNANPANRKTRKGANRVINGWFSRAQNRARASPPGGPPAPKRPQPTGFEGL